MISSQSEIYDIELAGGSTEEGENNRREFDNYLNGFNELFPPTEESNPIVHLQHLTVVTESYSLHRVRLPGAIVEDLLDNPKVHWLLLIDRIPQIEDDTYRLREVTANSIPPIPVIEEDAPRVVVIDSGIAIGHPLFSDENNSLINRQMCFLPHWVNEHGDPADYVERGHGTAVASIVAYGSVRDRILHNDPNTYPQFWVENAKILYSAYRSNEAPPEADRATLHELQVPYWLMQEVVREFHRTEPDKCRIFNLSVGAKPHRLNQVQSSWSEAIDNLSAQNDILFVVASGNLQFDEIDQLSQEVGTYPRYLLDEKARLRNPAQAINALTVGAISETDVLPVTARRNHQAVAPANHPAPFTRTGLQQSLVVKPDVVEMGGNLSYDSLTKSYTDRISTLAIPVANRNFLVGQPNGVITYQCGTSLATPKVANLAGKIQATHPNFSANLIRALIVNSAEWPQEIFNQFPNPLGTEDGNEIKRRKLQLCGYGIPQLDKALSANQYCIVLFTEGVFSWSRTNPDDLTGNKQFASKVSFYRATFNPDHLTQRDILGEQVRVSITLTYNPPVRKTNQDYQAVKMKWELKRPTETLNNFEGRLIRPDDEINEQYQTPRNNWEWEIKPVLNSGNRDRQGTVIKDWFETQLHGIPSEFEVAITAKVNKWFNNNSLEQHFALVVSVESLSQVPIYDRVEVRTQVRVQT